VRKFIVGAALAAALVIPASVTAADLHEPHLGLGCSTGFVGTFHFVNNQTGGEQSQGTLTAVIGGTQYVVGAYKINQNVQHFLVEDAEGTIESASTDLDGRLVLSDFSCEEKK
jgi:hypothetical protein